MKTTVGLVCLLLGLSAGAMAQAELSDEGLLAALDEARFFDPTVNVIRVRIESRKPEETRVAELRLLFAQIDGEDYTRIEFLSPPDLAGQIFLSAPGGTYFYGPDLDFPIKTSATTEVFGDSAVAQTSGIRFSGNYTVVERRTVALEDGKEIWEVDLAAVDFAVAFQAVTVRVDPTTLRPRSAVLYALSGIPFYDVFYEAYATQGEADVYVITQRIVNRLLIGRVTVSEILEIGIEELPPELFFPDAFAVPGTP